MTLASVVPSGFVRGFCEEVRNASATAKEEARLLGTVESTVLHVFLEELHEKVLRLEAQVQRSADDPQAIASAELALAKHVAEDTKDENSFLRNALNAEEVRLREMLWRLGNREQIFSDLKAHVLRQATNGAAGLSAHYAAVPFELVESLDAEVHRVQQLAAQRVQTARTLHNVAMQKQRDAYEKRLEAKEREVIQTQMRSRDALRSLELAHANEVARIAQDRKGLQVMLTDADQLATQRAEAFFAAKYEDRFTDARKEFIGALDALQRSVFELQEEKKALEAKLADAVAETHRMRQTAAYLQQSLQHVFDVELPKRLAATNATRRSVASADVTALQEEHMGSVQRIVQLEMELASVQQLLGETKQRLEREVHELSQSLAAARNEAVHKDAALRESNASRAQLHTQLQNTLKTEMQLHTEVDFLRRSGGASSAESFKKLLEQAEADHDVRMVELTEEARISQEKLHSALDEKVVLMERIRVSEAAYKACDTERVEFRTRSNKQELRLAEMKNQYDSVQEKLREVQRTLTQERDAAAAAAAAAAATAAAAASAAAPTDGPPKPSMQRTKSIRQSVVGWGNRNKSIVAGAEDRQPTGAGLAPTTSSVGLKRTGSVVRRVGSTVSLMVSRPSTASTRHQERQQASPLTPASPLATPTFVVGRESQRTSSASASMLAEETSKGNFDGDSSMVSFECAVAQPEATKEGSTTAVPRIAFEHRASFSVGDDSGLRDGADNNMSASQNRFVFPVSPRHHNGETSSESGAAAQQQTTSDGRTSSSAVLTVPSASVRGGGVTFEDAVQPSRPGSFRRHPSGTTASVGTQCTLVAAQQPPMEAPRIVHLPGATVPISAEDRRVHAQLRHELTVLHREVCFMEMQIKAVHEQHPGLQSSTDTATGSHHHSNPIGGGGRDADEQEPLWMRAGKACEERLLELEPIPLTDVTHRKAFMELNVAMATELEARHHMLLELRRIMADDLVMLSSLGASVARATVAHHDASVDAAAAPAVRPPTHSGHGTASEARHRTGGGLAVTTLRNAMPPSRDIYTTSAADDRCRKASSPPSRERSPSRTRLLLNSLNLEAAGGAAVAAPSRSCGGPRAPSRPAAASARPSSAASRQTWTCSSPGVTGGAPTPPASLVDELRCSVNALLDPAAYYAVGYSMQRAAAHDHPGQRPNSARPTKAPAWSSAMSPRGGHESTAAVPTVRIVSGSGGGGAAL